MNFKRQNGKTAWSSDWSKDNKVETHPWGAVWVEVNAWGGTFTYWIKLIKIGLPRGRHPWWEREWLKKVSCSAVGIMIPGLRWQLAVRYVLHSPPDVAHWKCPKEPLKCSVFRKVLMSWEWSMEVTQEKSGINSKWRDSKIVNVQHLVKWTN